MIYINNKSYDYIENITIYEFIQKHDIFLPSFDENKYDNIKHDISYVEIIGFEDVVNSKTTIIEDEMTIFTNSTKVHSYLYNLVKEKKSELKEQCYQEITLNEDEYNILLCQPECYEDCLSIYKERGFNDIISTKLGHMIVGCELCHNIINLSIKKYDKKKYKPLVVMLQSIIDLPSEYQFDIKPASEIVSQLIKNYYKEKLHIKKKINIIYVTRSVICLITHNARKMQYESYIDNIVEANYFTVTNNKDCFDGLFSNMIYKDNKTNLNVSINYNVIFKNLNQMGFKERSIEISTTEYGKEVVASYDALNLSFLFTDHFLTTEEIDKLNYDVIVITTRKQTMYANTDEGYLTDYNLNQIYRHVLIRPGYSSIFKRF